MRFLIISLLFITSTFISAQDDTKSVLKTDFFNLIENFGKAENVEDLKLFFDPEAYIAFNSNYESYSNVLSDDEYRQQVNETLFEKLEIARSRIDDENGNGFAFLTGISVNGKKVSHTICLKPGEDGKLKIIHWHAN